MKAFHRLFETEVKYLKMLVVVGMSTSIVAVPSFVLLIIINHNHLYYITYFLIAWTVFYSARMAAFSENSPSSDLHMVFKDQESKRTLEFVIYINLLSLVVIPLSKLGFDLINNSSLSLLLLILYPVIDYSLIQSHNSPLFNISHKLAGILTVSE